VTDESGQVEPADAVLLERARDGDASALHDLVDRHAARLFRTAVSLLGNAADAEDVLQETLAGAFRGLRTFQGLASVKTWLTGILVRQVAMHRRRAGRQEARLIRLQAIEPVTPDVPPATGRVDTRLDVTAAIRSLAPDHRDVIILRELEGLSYDEMAEALGVPRGTVESRLFRARRRLQELLKGYLD